MTKVKPHFQPYIISPSGDRTPVSPANGKDFQLEELQKAIDGYIEVVRIKRNGRDAIMIVDEDGISKKLVPNPRATALYVMSGGKRPIYGTVLICSPRQIK
jgi:hypothetical protein